MLHGGLSHGVRGGAPRGCTGVAARRCSAVRRMKDSAVMIALSDARPACGDVWHKQVAELPNQRWLHRCVRVCSPDLARSSAPFSCCYPVAGFDMCPDMHFTECPPPPPLRCAPNPQ